MDPNETTKKIYFDWKKFQWKAHLKAAIPGILILVVFAGYFLAEDWIANAPVKDSKLPIVESGAPEEPEPTAEAAAQADPDNPAPVPPGPERAKFDASEQAEIAQKNDMSLAELRGLTPLKEDKAALEKVEARFPEASSEADKISESEHIRALAATASADGYYAIGRGPVSLDGKAIQLEVLMEYRLPAPPAAAVAEGEAEPEEVCSQALVVANGGKDGVSRFMNCPPAGSLRRDGNAFVLLVPADQAGDAPLPLSYFAISIPNPGESVSKLEALPSSGADWLATKLAWTPSNRTELQRQRARFSR